MEDNPVVEAVPRPRLHARKARRAPTPVRHRPRLEVLEDRITPTTADFHPDPTLADSNSGNTLRAAVNAINTDTHDTAAVIHLAAGTYQLSLGELDLNPTGTV